MVVYTFPFKSSSQSGALVDESYSRVYSLLASQYELLLTDGSGSCFGGKDNAKAFLCNNARTTGIHEVVLINVPVENMSGLLKLIGK